MIPITEITNTLHLMARLLRDFELDSWADALQTLDRELADDASYTLWKIGRLFGGAGSLNDLVLQRNGKAPVDENNEFDELRSRLYEQCMRSRWIE